MRMQPGLSGKALTLTRSKEALLFAKRSKNSHSLRRVARQAGCCRLTQAACRVLSLFVSPPLPAPGPSLSQRLTLVVQALRAAIAAHAARDRTAVAVAWLVWPYLNRLAARFAALTLRVQAGKGVVVVVPATSRPRAAPETPHPRPPGLPQGFAWLARLTPSILPLRSQVCHLLGDPELAALLAAAPQAGRILRPLCRMLGIEAGPGFPPALFQRPDPPPGPSPDPPPSPALALPAPQAYASAPPQLELLPSSRPPPRRRAQRVPVFNARLA